MVKIEVCIGSSCYLKGSQKIIDYFQDAIVAKGLTSKIKLAGAFCLDNCGSGIAIKINEQVSHISTLEEAQDLFDKVMDEV